MTDIDKHGATDFVLSSEHLSQKPLEVSNADFIKIAFQGLAYQAGEGNSPCPLGVRFHGDPCHGNWTAVRLVNESIPSAADENNYYTLSVFRPDKAGKYSRKKELFSAQYVIGLDDVTPKVIARQDNKAQIPFDRITLAPSYVLETSENNSQVGFFLKQPITDPRKADELSKAIIAAGLSDPGAGGPTARLMRLPVGCNGKKHPPFQCRLRVWEPGCCYTPEEIFAGLGLKLTPEHLQTTAIPIIQPSQVSGGSSVFTPSPEFNIVLETLKSKGMVKKRTSSGKYEITCPWRSEHTDMADTGAEYWEPDEHHPVGGFKCLHGHCAGRNIKDLLEFLGVNPEDAYMFPRITIRPGEAKRIVIAVNTVLAQTGYFFQRSGRIVRVVRCGLEGRLAVEEVNASCLLVDLSSLTRWQHYDGRSKQMSVCDPPTKYLQAILEGGNHTPLPELIGITRQPSVKEDGAIRTESGYDPETKLYGDFKASDFTVPEAPTKEDAERALNGIEALLKEFPFEEECDRSAAVAAILTAVIRAQLRVAPMFHVRAHLPGSGKSYLTYLIAIFATGDDVGASNFPTNDEECQKLLISLLLPAPPVIMFDNLTTDIFPHKSLCMVLTEPVVSGRILGASRVTELSTRTLILSSGNNVGPIRDMTRRVVPIYLNPTEELPVTRQYKRPELLEEVKKQRGKYVSCALTIIAAWIRAGSPKTPSLRTLNSYSQWSDLCRYPLLWLGRPDPAQRVFEVMTEDPEREQVGAVFDAIHGYFEKRPFTVRDLAQWVEAHAVNSEVFGIFEEAGLVCGYALDRKRSGWWLKHHEGWNVNDKKLIRIKKSGKLPTYQLV